MNNYQEQGPHERFVQPKADTIHLMRNLPFEFWVKVWAALPPPGEAKDEVVYGDLFDVVSGYKYRISFQRRPSRDTKGNTFVLWYVYQVDLV